MYLSLCAEQILSTFKFSKKTNIGEYCGKVILAIIHQFMLERPRMLRIFSICLFLSILKESTYACFHLQKFFSDTSFLRSCSNLENFLQHQIFYSTFLAKKFFSDIISLVPFFQLEKFFSKAKFFIQFFLLETPSFGPKQNLAFQTVSMCPQLRWFNLKIFFG